MSGFPSRSHQPVHSQALPMILKWDNQKLCLKFYSFIKLLSKLFNNLASKKSNFTIDNRNLFASKSFVDKTIFK